MWLFIQHGHENVKEAVQGYYQNIAIVAALTGGFSVSMVLTPSFDLSETDARTVFIGISGCLILGIFTTCVLDCILIDNSMRLIADEKFVIHFMSTEQILLQMPLVLLVVGVALMFSNVAVTIWLLYGETSMIACFAILCTFGGAILRRYLILRSKMGMYANRGLHEIKQKMQPENQPLHLQRDNNVTELKQSSPLSSGQNLTDQPG